jgi:hypothetical protein
VEAGANRLVACGTARMEREGDEGKKEKRTHVPAGVDVAGGVEEGNPRRHGTERKGGRRRGRRLGPGKRAHLKSGSRTSARSSE